MKSPISDRKAVTPKYAHKQQYKSQAITFLQNIQAQAKPKVRINWQNEYGKFFATYTKGCIFAREIISNMFVHLQRIDRI